MAGITTFRGEAPPDIETGIIRRLAALLTAKGEAAAARRLAAAAFLARVFNAGLGFATQILLARWMGERDYGIYAYVWVWVLVAGGVGSIGLPVAALKFVPDYGVRGDLPGLRGFLRWSRTKALLPSAAMALVAAALMWAFGHGEAAIYLPVALVALAILPLYVLTDIQTGIARAYDFADLGLAADYVLRPALLLLFAGGLALVGGSGSALSVMVATLAAMAVTTIAQGSLLQARLAARIPAGPVRLDIWRWLDTAWPLLTVTGFTLLLGSTDILVLKLFVGPEEIALYFAATKLVAIASFVSYGVANTSAHRFAGHIAKGDGAAMAALAAETVRWTFWPTLAVALAISLLAAPLLSLFGPAFSAGAPVVAILALGLVLGAAVGPADRALAMADHGRVTASIYAASFAANLVFALVLIPVAGLSGAAAATALATGLRTAFLFVATRRRLGLDMLVFPLAGARPIELAEEDDALVGEMRSLGDCDAAFEAAWRDLADRAAEPNVFYRPETALAGLRHLPEGQGGRILAVWRGEGEARHLVGLLPLVACRRRSFNPFAIRRAAAFYGTLSTPLVDPAGAGQTIHCLLRTAARHGQAGLLFPHLAIGGPLALALDEVCARHGTAQVTLDSHRRAMLRSTLPGADYLRATLEPKRRKEADRQRRRLAEDGALAFRVVSGPDEIPAALDVFLALESAGWKGEAGTDLRHAPGGEPFIREATVALARSGAFRIVLLTLDGRPVAAGLVGIHGGRAFYEKTAYDEAFARFSPGLLLTLDLTAHLLADPAIADADSIAVADHPMIDRVWTERFAVSSVLVSTRPGRSLVFRAAVMTERLRERAVVELKALRDRIERSRKGAVHAGAKKEPQGPAA